MFEDFDLAKIAHISGMLARHPLRELNRWRTHRTALRFIREESADTTTYPPAITVELTNHCNLKCPLCPTGNKSQKRPAGFASPDLFRAIVDEVSPGCRTLALHSYGESLLHPHFSELVRYAVSRDMYAVTDSNLNSIRSYEQACAVVDSGISEIHVSLDGVDQETYEKYRVCGKFDSTIRAVTWLILARTERRQIYPKITLQFLMMKHNESFLDRFKQLCRDLGVDGYRIGPIWVDLQAKDHSRYAEFIPEHTERSWYQKDDTGGWSIAAKKLARYCRHPFSQMLVHWNGDVGFCCLDFQSQLLVGNVAENGALAVWNGAKMKRLRRLVKDDITALKPCSTCPMSRVTPDKGEAAVLSPSGWPFLKNALRPLLDVDRGAHVPLADRPWYSGSSAPQERSSVDHPEDGPAAKPPGARA